MWDRDKKYTGKPYDLLDDKLKIFYSICYHADIEPGQFHAVFPRILDGRAEEYYLHFVDQRMDTFLTAYHSPQQSIKWVLEGSDWID
ncbi:hypothetical protein PtrM4_074080 [Pyrenophora tritici-repentis]|uniref:Uncharacterized protein n=1 Tax=Pyrenophora tritici-repentis TaxID=45151 RepID=A0A834RYI9_9PLEO|nr:hypothetical protein PtrM4_074080 [Pyrenophora tritici-repentis]